MNKIQELRNKRLETWEKAKTFLEDKRDEKGIVSAEDTAAYEKMEVESAAGGGDFWIFLCDRLCFSFCQLDEDCSRGLGPALDRSWHVALDDDVASGAENSWPSYARKSAAAA